MDEVDRIILSSLKELNCDFEDDVKYLRHLTCENIIEGFARCLNLINPSLNISTQLPPTMSERFKLGATLANSIKDLGYKDDIGYQTFLYSNEIEIRRLFTFVIEKLPKEKESKTDEGNLSSLQQDISNAVRLKLGLEKLCLSCKQPFISVPLETGVSLPGMKREVSPQEWCKFCSEQLPFLHEQTDYRFLLPSIITLNSRGILCPSQSGKRIPSSLSSKEISSGESSMLKHLEALKLIEDVEPAERFDADKKSEASGDQEKNEEEILSELEAKVQELTSHGEKFQSQFLQVNNLITQSTKQYENNLREDRVRLLLTQGDDSRTKLLQLAEEKNKKLMRLKEQWEEHRSELLQRCDEAQNIVKSKSNFSNEKLEAIQEKRNTLKSLLEQLKKKQAIQSKLEGEVAALSKHPKPLRSAFTHRIMEIISNIRKQTNEINKIIADTKELQRDVNTVTGRLERVFSVADDLIFQAAKKDDVARRVYKSLVALHSDCAEMVSLVEETGALIRESKDLEEQISAESAKNVSENLNLVLKDLRKMKEEKAGKKRSL